MIKKLVLKGKHPGPHLLVTAGVHGDEYEPMEACRRLYLQLQDEMELLHGKITLVPVVNHPAFAMASRTGPDGLDLARICPGRADGTISERIAHAVSELITSADYYIDMHNGGHLYNIYPFSGYVLHPDHNILMVQQNMARSFGLPIVWGTDPTLPGRTLSVARDANIPAIYIEIGGAGIYNESMTKLAVQGCKNVLANLNLLKIIENKKPVRYHVEDHRRESGFLQRLLPSPADGFFMPEVAFEEPVKKGQPIGLVQDALGQVKTPILADQDGIVFILRNSPSVHKGDSLGAILPATQREQIQSIYE
ncbi:MAG: succinylglutamate desuccinylase [Saprospiraceae bacterium]|nr:succinylglutamate desuccinylase [Saprospiraceae bacterium]